MCVLKTAKRCASNKRHGVLEEHIHKVVGSAVWGGGVSPTQERKTKSAVVHKWAYWLHNPCRWGGFQHFTVGDKISGVCKVRELACDPYHGGGGVTKASEPGTKSVAAHKWADRLRHLCK